MPLFVFSLPQLLSCLPLFSLCSVSRSEFSDVPGNQFAGLTTGSWFQFPLTFPDFFHFSWLPAPLPITLDSQTFPISSAMSTLLVIFSVLNRPTTSMKVHTVMHNLYTWLKSLGTLSGNYTLRKCQIIKMQRNFYSKLAWGVRCLHTPTSHIYSKGSTQKFLPKVTNPLVNWAPQTFDGKLRPNG